MRPEKLAATAIRQALTALNAPGVLRWRLVRGTLSCSMQFSSFKQAFHCMSQIAQAAERMEHHPDWSNSYRTVNIQLRTHSAKGLTALDIELAKKINNIAKKYAPQSL